MLIESQMHGVLNWGLGAAISTVLLLIVLSTYYLLDRAIGVEPVNGSAIEFREIQPATAINRDVVGADERLPFECVG